MKSVLLAATIIFLTSIFAACAYRPDDEDSSDKVILLSPKDTAASVSSRRSRASEDAWVQYGIAAYYSNDLEGKLTANGERYNKNKYTAAHSSLPFGTICRVTNMQNGRQVQVRINDRQGNIRGRIIDLSFAAMSDLGAIRNGIVEVKIEIVE